MEFHHRLLILGDPHISDAERPLWEEEVIPDINALAPDLALILGDLTGGSEMGTAEGTRKAVETLSLIQAPWASIIGNHDLQAPEFDSDEAAVAMMLNALKRDRPGFVIERELFAIIGLGNTFWRRNPVNKNEIVIDDEQLAWWETELARLGQKPVIIICHAPPIGSGVLVLPELHARVGNAYVNQSAVPGKIQEVIWKHPNILFWFSGHNHLGQHYRDALSQQLGVLYAHTGTASRSSSRDGHRHSRLLEIGPDGYRVRTFDHGLRALDPELDFSVAHPLSVLAENRKRFLGSRFVPRDPSTMVQPAPGVLKPTATTRRYLFLSDAHSTAPLSPIQKRVAEWCGRQALQMVPDVLLLGGDLTHHPVTAEAEAFLEVVAPGKLPVYYLPGNNEGSGFSYPAKVEPVTCCTRLEERVWLLATPNPQEAQAAVDALLADLPAAGSCLVFAHFPPFLAGEERLKQLEEAPFPIYWICGHRHEALESESGALHVRVCAGLDPVKTRNGFPELLLIDWDGEAPAIQRVPVPGKYLHPYAPVHRAGLAFRASGEDLLKLALERKIPAIQFHYRHSFGPPLECERALAKRYRETVPGAFLSLHLPNFPHPEEGPDLADMGPCLQYAEGIGVDDLTIHLPDVSAATLFREDETFQETDWARNCLQTYTELSTRALQMGAQISFENVYNKKVNPPGEERLASQPWQLLRFVEAVRRQLRENGVAEESVNRVGIIFDAGHAFADVQMAKRYGLADWLVRIAPYLQLSHIHQVTLNPEKGGTRNHQTIRALHGPLVNFEGLLAAFRDVSSQPFPLLIEVREQDAALESYATLTGSGLVANGSPKAEA